VVLGVFSKDAVVIAEIRLSRRGHARHSGMIRECSQIWLSCEASSSLS
jgi:hypothetical protein